MDSVHKAETDQVGSCCLFGDSLWGARWRNSTGSWLRRVSEAGERDVKKVGSEELLRLGDSASSVQGHWLDSCIHSFIH